MTWTTPSFGLSPSATPPWPVNLKHGLLGLALALGSVSASAQLAVGEIRSFSAMVAPSNSTATDLKPLTLPQFDPLLGDLQGVSFRVELASYSETLELLGYDKPSGANFDSATMYGGQYSVSKRLPLGGGMLLASVLGGFGDISDEADTLNSSGMDLSASEDATSRLQSNGVFSDFIGTGSVLGMDWGYFFFSNHGSTVRLDNGFEVDADVGVSQMNGGATIYVDYLYTAAPIPEPASIAMMLAGLGLMAGVVRRRSASRTVV